MIIENRETWGVLKYNTKNSLFSYSLKPNTNQQPYVTKPIVLNCYLTYKCNMDCKHCVAKDLKDYNSNGIVLSDKLLKDINNSPFMVIVLTGGEPLLKENESKLVRLIEGIENKGIVIDTNGSIYPSSTILKLAKKKNVLFRISFDSPILSHELKLRVFKNDIEKSKMSYYQKLEMIEDLSNDGFNVSIQSVLYKKNKDSIERIMYQLKDLDIRSWYIQRLIPTNKLKPTGKRGKDEPYFLESEVYEEILSKLENKSKSLGIKCITKRDRRHNCVFIMVNSGLIYTSSEQGNGRVLLGKMCEIENYFEFVSSSEHSARYYSDQDRTN